MGWRPARSTAERLTVTDSLRGRGILARHPGLIFLSESDLNQKRNFTFDCSNYNPSMGTQLLQFVGAELRTHCITEGMGHSTRIVPGVCSKSNGCIQNVKLGQMKQL